MTKQEKIDAAIAKSKELRIAMELAKKVWVESQDEIDRIINEEVDD